HCRQLGRAFFSSLDVDRKLSFHLASYPAHIAPRFCEARPRDTRHDSTFVEPIPPVRDSSVAHMIACPDQDRSSRCHSHKNNTGTAPHCSWPPPAIIAR